MRSAPRPIIHRLLLPLGAALCLSSCGELDKTRVEAAQVQEKIQQLQQEVSTIDAGMARYRQGIPAYAGQGEAGAKRYAVELAKELAGVENEIAATHEAARQAQAALDAARAELQALKSKDPRLVK